MEISVSRNILEQNALKSEELKALFKDKGVFVLNIISSPGSGKTSLLERTLNALKEELKMAVIEGDVLTDNDARRVAATGAQAVQINTDGGCHLDSAMVTRALEQIDLEGLDVLFVENVGNLVCPAEFEVGEDVKVALLSVTEGDDKPQKYPLLFELSKVMVLNKTDLLPYVDFDLERAATFARKLNADIEIFTVSCRSGDGLESWYDWLRESVRNKRART
jgi:hydrogenase nickel incorporation protein HypB